jgi:3-hydroxybutyryl-CoA dehydrogenase
MNSEARITVIGAGTMGHGIAHVSALAGYTVALYDVDEPRVQAGLAKIKKNLDGGVEKGKVAVADRDAALARLRGSTDLAEAVAGAELVIEAIPERLELKQALFRSLAELTEPDTILGTNTSSLPVARIAEAAGDPSRVVGLHFFNPVHIMSLLEVVFHPGTANEVLDVVRAYGQSIGKECIFVKDSPGFATSRLGVAIGMEAIRMLEEGVASAEDIDKAMVLGYRHPVGPLKLTDMVGLDVRLNIGEHLARTLGNPAFEPPALLRRLVAEGKLGQKTGAGFYRW